MSGLTEPGSAIYAVLVWLHGSPLGEAMRSSGVWTYGVVNLIHILGVASLFGAILILDLRLLGVWKTISIAELSAITTPIAVTGFCVAAATGVCMISTNATDYAGNPFLLIKFPLIALGLLNAAVVSRSAAWRALGDGELTRPYERRLAVMAGVSLACWTGAVAAGRMIGYW